MQDPESKVRKCLYLVIQNPVCSRDPTYVGKTHFTVLTRDWSQYVARLYAIVQSYGITPMRLVCQQRVSWTCMEATKAFMTDNIITTATTERLTEEGAMGAVNKILDACGALRACRTIDVPYSVLEDISLFTGMDICIMVTAKSDSVLHECMKTQVRTAMIQRHSQ